MKWNLSLNDLLRVLVILGLLALIPTAIFLLRSGDRLSSAPRSVGTTTLNHGSVSSDGVRSGPFGSETNSGQPERNP